MADKYKAYLRIRRIDTRECVHSIGLSSLTDSHVERVMLGALRNMDMENFVIDDSEVDEARKQEVQ